MCLHNAKVLTSELLGSAEQLSSPNQCCCSKRSHPKFVNLQAVIFISTAPGSQISNILHVVLKKVSVCMSLKEVTPYTPLRKCFNRLGVKVRAAPRLGVKVRA